ncbi:MAG TPA: PP2C family serine/threonine-protein phosphatase [Alphaproteobacteria bacterium]|nr:PP2C family serine/threonine-protein phosphatase [Alphaproteobacteria bacterium]
MPHLTHSGTKKATRHGELAWRSSFRSDPGAVRKVNEDAWLDLPEAGVWAVADGMGGHEAGDISSRMVVDAIKLPNGRGSTLAVVDEISARLRDVNTRLRALSAERYRGRQIGSTIAVLMAVGRRAICLWAGDSRIYRYRKGQLAQLTRDHSHVADLIAKGLLDVRNASLHQHANVITRAVGAAERLLLDRQDDDVEDDDIYVLCSDGLTRVLDDREIAASLGEPDCSKAAKALLAAALARRPRDNVTVGVVRATQPPAT